MLSISRSVISIDAKFLKSMFWFVFGSFLHLGIAVGVWDGHWVVPVGGELPIKSESFSYLLRGREFYSKSGFRIRVLSVSVLFTPYPLFFTSTSPVLLSAMPHQRGIPRRGGNTGSCVGYGGHGNSAPHRISPTTIASPSSPTSDSSEPTLNSSLHSTRFKFKSQLDRSLISAIVAVIFSEEEVDTTSSDEMSKDQSPSHHSSDSQSSLVGAFLNVSVSGQEAGQQKEIHPQLAIEDMAEKVYIEEGQQEDTQVPEESQHPTNMTQEEIIVCEPVQWEGGILKKFTTPDGEPVFDEYGFVTWEEATSNAVEDKKDEIK